MSNLFSSVMSRPFHPISSSSLPLSLPSSISLEPKKETRDQYWFQGEGMGVKGEGGRESVTCWLTFLTPFSYLISRQPACMSRPRLTAPLKPFLPVLRRLIVRVSNGPSFPSIPADQSCTKGRTISAGIVERRDEGEGYSRFSLNQ